jgi:PAS domain S-box-containing protein
LALFGGLLFVGSLVSAEGTPVTIQLKYYHQFQFSGYYAAEAQGYYRAAGLDVRIKEGAPEIDPVEEVVSGRAQFGVTDATLLLARAEGRPVEALGVVFQHSPGVLLVRRQRLGQDLESLAGKRVMLGAANADILAFLKKKGLPPDRFVVVPHSFNVQDLIEGRVDAMTAYSTVEQYSLDQIGFPYQVFSPRTVGIDFYGDTLFTDEQEVRAHPDTVKTFRAASMQGWQYAMAHPEEMADLILDRYSKRRNRAQLLFEASQMVQLLQPDLVEMGYMNPERWKHIGETFVDMGMLRKGFSLDGFLYKPKPETDFYGLLRWIAGLFVLAAGIFAYQIHRAKSSFQAIFNFTNDAIFIHELTSGAILDVNLSATEMFGYTRDQLRAMPVEGISSGIPPHTQADALGWIHKAAEGSPQVFEWLCKNRSGHLFWVEVNMRKATINGHGRLIVAVRDITERKRLKAEVEHMQRMESMGRLAGGVAHDMNNVLGAILGLSSAHLASLPRDNPLYSSLKTICAAATRGGDMVKRLLAFSHQTSSEYHGLNLNALILEEVRLLERTTLAKLHLEMDLSPDLRPILGDDSALTHAIMNLCVNAVDAMSDGGTLTFRTRNLGLDQVEVAVEDNGSGMTGEVLDRAMDPFFTTKAVGKGTGLGLSLVFTTVNAHGGHLEIHSAPDRGTRVTMTFPATTVRAPRPELEAPVRPDVKGRAIQVLLVDDDELIQRSTRMLVEALGHTVTSTLDGEAAIDLIEQGFQPDVVILDMNMPGLGGKGTLPRLRGLCPTVPVLLATGRADQEALDLVAAHPFVTLVSKPFSFEDLRGHLLQVAGCGPKL